MYKCLSKNTFRDKQGYQLTSLRLSDIQLIRQWRNSQVDILRQVGQLSVDDQIQYYENVVKPSFEEIKPRQILFSFLLNDDCIGYGGLTYIDWNSKRGEVSFLVNSTRVQDKNQYRMDFIHFLNLLCEVSFNELNFHRIYTEVYAFRKEHLEILEEFGFKLEGILKEHVYQNEEWIDSLLHRLLAKEWNWNKTYEQVDTSLGILVTSIGNKIPLLKALRTAGTKITSNLMIHGSDCVYNCIGKYGVDQFWHCAPLNQMTIEEIITYCQKYTIHFIIPTRDMDLPFFAEYKEELQENEIAVHCSSLETILLCLDKKLFADFMNQNKVLVVPTFLTIDEFDSAYYVVKERYGAGCRQLGLKLTREKAIEHSKLLRDPIFQPYIEGHEWSVDVYRSFKGEVKGCVARQRNLVVNGESQVTTTFHHPVLEGICHSLSNLLNIHGHAIFQFIESKSDHQFYLIECNARFGGASTASVAVGLDSFFWFLVESRGEGLVDFPFSRLDGDVKQVRYPTDHLEII